MTSARELLERRLADSRLRPFDFRVELEHFTMATWAVAPEKLLPHYDPERFELDLVETNDGPRALVSAVSFLNADFRVALAPFAPMVFGQTNYRFYVVDRSTGEHATWFFGTTLGHDVVHVARGIFKLPWHSAEYTFETARDATGRYTRFREIVRSEWAPAVYDLVDTGERVTCATAPGYPDEDAMRLRLTHPVTGYFHRADDGAVGTYSVWHDYLDLRVARPRHLRIELFARLGLVDDAEMARPHSVLITPRALFHIHMPPRRVSARSSTVSG